MSVDVELVEEPLVGAAAAWSFPCAVFGVTGAAAATAVVTAEASAGVLVPACALAFKAMAGAAVFAVVVALPDVALPDVVSVVPGSAWTGPDGPGGGASGCELAAMAAAAIANGAVGPEADTVVGTLVVGVDVGTATATGVGVAGELPTCCARMVASTTVVSASASSSLDLWPPDFEVLGVVVAVVVDWLAALAAAPLPLALAGLPALELELASDDGPLLVAALESSLACACACGAGALLSALAVLLSALFAGAASLVDGGEASASFCWGGDGGGGGGAAAESLGVFWLTRFPKRSFAGGALDRVSHDGAAWNAALAAAAASGVALSTGRSPAREFTKQSAKTGPLGVFRNI